MQQGSFMSAENIIISETMKGATGLVEYGVLGILALIGIGFMMWNSYQCAQSTKEVVKNNTDAINNLKESNTAALNTLKESNANSLKDIAVALAKLDR